MNEVTQIHLGRQAFAISAAAHKDLRDYLGAIKQQVSDREVVDEVELRMAELLAEHGVTDDQVVLPQDVAFLQEQLGDPQDFHEETADGKVASPSGKQADSKRLFRDTDNAMLAGVAAGLAQYLGVDVLLIRILFIIGVFTGGWGIIIYAVLWLLAPEAKTSSDRLQMAGKPVTINSLRGVVDRADVKGAARRANRSLAGPINSIFKVLLKLIGLTFIIFGLIALIGLVSAETYTLLRGGNILQGNIFPVGLQEHLLLDVAIGVVGLIALFIVLIGMAMFRRGWPVHAWVTGVLVGLLLIGMATGGALAANTVPAIRDRYNADLHTTVRTLKPFSSIQIIGNGDGSVPIAGNVSNQYSVSFHYHGHPDLASLQTTVSNGTLFINTQQFNEHRRCETICIPSSYNMVMVVSASLPVPPIIPDIPDKGM